MKKKPPKRMHANKRPTELQKVAVKLYAETVRQGKKPEITKVMAAAGYAPSVAKQGREKFDIEQPHLKKLLAKELPKSYIAKKVRSQMNARTIKSVDFSGKCFNPLEAKKLMEEQGFIVVNVKAAFGKVFVTYFEDKHDIIDKTIDKVAKINGDYAPEQVDVRNMNIDASDIEKKLANLSAMKQRYVKESEDEIAVESDELG